MTITTDQSYASLVQANAYATARNWSDWDAATTEAKEAALLDATAYLDATFRWPGSLAASDQTLGWPRSGAYDIEGRSLTGVPTMVVSATIEAARLALTAPLIGGSSNPEVKRVREKVGPLEEETEYVTRAGWEARADRLAWVASLLRTISGLGSGSSVRLVRA